MVYSMVELNMLKSSNTIFFYKIFDCKYSTYSIINIHKISTTKKAL